MNLKKCEFINWNFNHFIKIYKNSMKLLQNNYFARKYSLRYVIYRSSRWKFHLEEFHISKKVFLLSLSTKRIISSTPFPDHTSFSSFSMSFSFFFFFLKRINTEEQIVHFSFKRNWKLLRYNLMHLKLNLNYIWIRSTSDDISYFFK